MQGDRLWYGRPPVSLPFSLGDVSPKPMREAFFLARIANFISNALRRSGNAPPPSSGHPPEIAGTWRGKDGGLFIFRNFNLPGRKENPACTPGSTRL
jgi:hypothetical protein